MIVADLMDCIAAPTIDAGVLDAGTDGHDDDGPTPVKRFTRSYLNPEGDRVQVITEWWWMGTAPVGRDADPDPDMPGHVVTQFVRRTGDGEDAIFNPMSRNSPASSAASFPSVSAC